MPAKKTYAIPLIICVLMLLRSFSTMSSRKQDHEAISKQFVVPVLQMMVCQFMVPKDSTLTIAITQNSDRHLEGALYSEKSYRELVRILEGGEGDLESIPRVRVLEGIELKASGVEVSKGTYFFCLMNLSEQELTLDVSVSAFF